MHLLLLYVFWVPLCIGRHSADLDLTLSLAFVFPSLSAYSLYHHNRMFLQIITDFRIREPYPKPTLLFTLPRRNAAIG